MKDHADSLLRALSAIVSSVDLFIFGLKGEGMVTILRTLTALSGLGLLVFGLGWWVHPAAAADMLGASLLDGTGRTTQIGDSGAFFVGAGIDVAVGSDPAQPRLLLAGGGLIGLVIPGRVLSASIHGGSQTPDEIIAECVILALAVVTAAKINRANAQNISSERSINHSSRHPTC